MIKISNEAQKYLKKILDKQKKSNILRISIELPGTKYATCKIFYDNVNNIKDNDIKIQYTDFSIYVNNILISYLKNSKIDLFYNNLEQQLMLMAPYATKDIQNKKLNKNTTILEQHVLFQKVDDYIDKYINPMLSNHGGKIILVNITNTGYVMIEFFGGCNGCTMSSTTVKDGIEKKILSYFPTLKGVQDITNHSRGKHSYF